MAVNLMSVNPIDCLTSPVAVQLTSALVHFLWQGCAIALAVAGASRLLCRASASTRYAVAAAGLWLMAACVPITYWSIAGTQADSAARGAAAAMPAERPAD